MITGIQTYVLVIFFMNSVTAITGYGSISECEAAAKMLKTVNTVAPHSSYCIPGPVEVR